MVYTVYENKYAFTGLRWKMSDGGNIKSFKIHNYKLLAQNLVEHMPEMKVTKRNDCVMHTVSQIESDCIFSTSVISKYFMGSLVRIQ